MADSRREDNDKRRVGKKHVDDVMAGVKALKPAETVSRNAAIHVYNDYKSAYDSRAKGNETRNQNSNITRGRRKAENEEHWPHITDEQLGFHPDWETDDVVEFIQGTEYGKLANGKKYACSTIATVVSPIVVAHKKRWRGNN